MDSGAVKITGALGGGIHVKRKRDQEEGKKGDPGEEFRD
jgi:hypothetical protein